VLHRHTKQGATQSLPSFTCITSISPVFSRGRKQDMVLTACM